MRESGLKSCSCTKNKNNYHHSIKLLICFFIVLLTIIVLSVRSSPFAAISHPGSSISWAFFPRKKEGVGAKYQSEATDAALIAKLRESVTFLPLKDPSFTETAAMTGNTWFMSSLNDTLEQNETEYLNFPSEASKGRLLCLKGRDTKDGAKNSYALAWRESIPDSATLFEGLTFVSDTYYNHENLWHGISAAAPFVRWSMKNGCVRPTRWVLFHWGELRFKMGSWLEHLLQANYGDVKVEGFNQGNGGGEGGPYCFEKAIVMRHDIGKMGDENKLMVFDLLRCKARKICSLNQEKIQQSVNVKGKLPVIRLTLLLRRGSRSFKNERAVIEIFAKECAKVEGCILNVVKSEDLSFCDQVQVMSNTDIVASPHGAQLTNMLFMDQGSSVMEFFPKGWLEHAGIGQYAHHWMANLSGMKHRGAWWDSNGEECPNPKDDLKCFEFHKDGLVGHNETYFSQWTREVLVQVRLSKLQQGHPQKQADKTNACAC